MTHNTIPDNLYRVPYVSAIPFIFLYSDRKPYKNSLLDLGLFRLFQETAKRLSTKDIV